MKRFSKINRYAIILSLILAALAGEIASNYAYAYRGYFAIGGEVFVFPLVFICVYCLIYEIFYSIAEYNDDRRL